MDSRPCEAPANFRYTWPGKDEALICMEHAEKLKSIANAMGVHLQLIPFTSHDITDALNWPNCQQKMS